MMLIQTATAVATTTGLDARVVEAAFAVILGVNVWMIRVVTQTREGVRSITQSLFGVSGDNGINSAVIDHEHRITATEGYIERTVPERLKQWEAWKASVDKVVHSANNAANEAVLNHRPRIVSLENDRDNDRRSGTDRRHHE